MPAAAFNSDEPPAQEQVTGRGRQGKQGDASVEAKKEADRVLQVDTT